MSAEGTPYPSGASVRSAAGGSNHPVWPEGSADMRERRRRRAAVAELLLARAPVAAAALDWDALDAAPAWLGRPAPAFAALQAQVGAVLCAPAMRLWIDTARLAAARAALGDAFLRALLAQADLPALPAPPRIASAAQVAPALQATGAAVLRATLPLALRGPAAAAMAPPAPLEIDALTAHAAVERALALADDDAGSGVS